MHKILWGFVIACVAGIGFVSYLLLRTVDHSNEALTEDTNIQAELVTNNVLLEQPITGMESLMTLLSRLEELECTITYDDIRSSSTISGTYFTSEGRLRGDFIVPELGGSDNVSSMILRDNTLYTWTIVGGEGYGMQIDLSTLATVQDEESAPDTNEPVPLDIPVAYSCTSWTAKDDSIFELPKEVIFKDYVSLMNVGMEYGTVYEEASMSGPAGSPCNLCNQVPPGEGQDECKERFQCQ